MKKSGHRIDVNIKRGIGFAFSRAWLKNIIKAVLSAEKINKPVEVSLLVTDDRHMHKMNLLYRGINAPTDVLSFALTEKPVDAQDIVFPEEQIGLTNLGEIIISFPRIVEQAADHGVPMAEETALMTVHGMLHLLGYDHGNAAEARKMRRREKAILTLIQQEQVHE